MKKKEAAREAAEAILLHEATRRAEAEAEPTAAAKVVALRAAAVEPRTQVFSKATGLGTVMMAELHREGVAEAQEFEQAFAADEEPCAEEFMMKESHAGAAGSPSPSAGLDVDVKLELHQVGTTKAQVFEAQVKPRCEKSQGGGSHGRPHGRCCLAFCRRRGGNG